MKLESWHHVALTFRADGCTLYLDGESISSHPGSALPLADTLAPLLVGASSQGNFPFSGEIDEVAIYDRALDTREIEEHHAVGTIGR